MNKISKFIVEQHEVPEFGFNSLYLKSGTELEAEDLEVGKRYFLNRVIFETPDILKFLEENSLLPDIIVLKDNNQNELMMSDDRRIGIPDYVLDALRFRR